MASHESGYEIIKSNFVYEDFHVYSVCGSMAILHIIALNILNPKSLTFVDVNPIQVAWNKAQIELIKKSENLNDYLERLYCRDFGNNLKNLVYTEPDNSWDIDDVFKDVKDLAIKLKMAKPDKAMGIKKELRDEFDVLKLDIIKPYADLNSDGELHHWVEDEEVQICHAITDNYKERRRNIHFIYNDWGFYSNKGFRKVKHYLKFKPITFKTESIFDTALEDKCYVYLSTAWVMNEDEMLKLIFDKREIIKKGDMIIRGRNLKAIDATSTVKRFMNYYKRGKRSQSVADRVAQNATDSRQIRYILSTIENFEDLETLNVTPTLKRYIDRYKKDKKFQAFVDRVVKNENDSKQIRNILSKIVNIVEYKKHGTTESSNIMDKIKNIIGKI